MDGFTFIIKKQEAPKILNDPKFGFKIIVDPQTAEKLGYGKAKRNGINYTPLSNDTIKVSGNFYHYYCGRNNIGLFPDPEVKEAIAKFCCDHNHVDPKGVSIEKIEIGLNLSTERCVNCILDDIVTYLCRRRGVSPYKRDGLQYYFNLEDYKLVFYNKTAKHHLNQNVLRVELVAKNGLLKKLNIYTLADLYDNSKVSALYMHLRGCIARTVFTDREMDLKKLPKTKAQMFHNLRNDIDWIELNRKDRKNMSRTRERYQGIIDQYGTNNTKKWILEEFDRKLAQTQVTEIGKSEEFSGVDKEGKNHQLGETVQSVNQPLALEVLKSDLPEKWAGYDSKKRGTALNQPVEHPYLVCPSAVLFVPLVAPVEEKVEQRKDLLKIISKVAGTHGPPHIGNDQKSKRTFDGAIGKNL